MYPFLSIILTASHMQVNVYLAENGIEVREYATVATDIALLASDQLKPSSTQRDIQTNGVPNEAEKVEGDEIVDLIWVDSASCCYALYSKLNPDKVILKQSPLALSKALKVLYPVRWLLKDTIMLRRYIGVYLSLSVELVLVILICFHQIHGITFPMA